MRQIHAHLPLRYRGHRYRRNAYRVPTPEEHVLRRSFAMADRLYASGELSIRDLHRLLLLDAPY